MIPLLPVIQKIDGSISWDPTSHRGSTMETSREVRLPDAMWLVWDNGLIRTMRRGSGAG